MGRTQITWKTLTCMVRTPNTPDSLEREALEDVMATLAHHQETVGLDIISDGRVHGDNYADQSLYYYFKRLGYDLRGGYLGLPIYSRAAKVIRGGRICLSVPGRR